MKLLPQRKVPKLGSEGETYRQHQLAHQLPKQDLSLQYCQHVAGKDKSSFQDFICARNDIALDIGYIVYTSANGTQGSNNSPKRQCRKCQKEISKDDISVVAPRFGMKSFWHPTCFTCNTCNELLVSDFAYIC